jgi:hypothetical protein
MDLEDSLAVLVTAEVLVLVGPRVEHPSVAEPHERIDVRNPRHHRPNRDLDVDDRLGRQTRHRCRAHVLDLDREVAEGRPDPGGLGFEVRRPGGVVRVDRVGTGPALGLPRLRPRATQAPEQGERVEERLLGGVALSCLLRMPLHAEHPGRGLVLLVGHDPFDRLDQPVGGLPGDGQPFAEPIDPLMMMGRARQRAGLRNRGETAPRLRHDVVDRLRAGDGDPVL